jgi:hypothetical protein
VRRRPGRYAEIGPFSVRIDPSGVSADFYTERDGARGGLLHADFYMRVWPHPWTVLMVRNRIWQASVSTAPSFGVCRYLWERDRVAAVEILCDLPGGGGRRTVPVVGD